ncbi:PDDEXK family nuclease [Thioalkalivibrio thiocyanodenitrificans]|uniref:hypothetical protein n=1 Tax=Thioalkalivibrio thiocyanodenitrificans TaxID=243063 RepID=UPI000368302D|nr:hypothetical protein [Thioalkalivibrio thiocyanodenitrificans]
MLFYLDDHDKTSLTEVPASSLATLGWLEKDLEEMLAKHIDKVVREDQLLVIHQERRYQEEPDILGLDESGNLHIFELKRWRSSSENLLQVLRYGQRFGRYDYDGLNHLFRNYLLRVGSAPERELVVAHKEYFELEEALSISTFNKEQRFVVVTDGLDRETREAIDYWSQHGLPVAALPYHVYRTNSGDLLFEVWPYGPKGDTFMEIPDGLVVVNTNSTYMPDVWKEMLSEQKAAAYYGRKTAVSGIPKGSPIALYHTGVGIIAFGRTTDTLRRAPCGDDPDEEYYVPCEFEAMVDPVSEPHKAVSAREVNEALGASHRFRLTAYTLPPDAVEFVRKSLREKADTAD